MMVVLSTHLKNWFGDMSKKIELDIETADRITRLTLIDYRKCINKELADFRKGKYLHSEDVVGNLKRLEALNLIIKDFGVEE